MRRYSFVDFDAVVGFVDLAGFTAATERLGRIGPRGTEQLGGLINALFTPAIDIIHRAGGEVGWFAGDAIGVLFDRAVTPDAAAVSALSDAAAAIIALSPMDTDAGELTLSVKVGVAAGPVRWNTLGEEQQLAWFGGPPIDLASDAEHHTEPGDVVLHDSVALVGGDGAALAPVADGFSLLVAPPEGGFVAAGHPLSARHSLDHQPSRIARLALAGDLALLDEHRPVTSVFVRFPESAHDPVVLDRVCSTIEEMGGLLQSATEGDKGAIALALFGVPTALADRHVRAIVAADRLRTDLPGAAIGIASGRVYAGKVGSDARWDYSLIGDRVNTAARLMQAAVGGEVLVDAATADAAGSAIETGPRRALDLKGKTDKETVLPVVSVRARSTNDTDAGYFVGRRDEAAALTDAIAAPGVLVVVGPAGTGKSRLLRHAVSGVAQGPAIVRMQQTDRGRPFGLWQRLLPAVLGWDDGAAAEQLPDEIRNDPRFPLLAMALGRREPDTPLTAGLAPDDRIEALASLVIDTIEATGSLRPTAVEDLHWSDDGSRELLARTAGRLAGTGCSLVATSRPGTEIDPLVELPAVAVLELAPIGLAEMADLARHLWHEQLGVEAVPSLAEDLAERSGGSPLFCEQLVTFARTHGVAPTIERLPTEAGLPTTLTDLLLARLDALPEAASTVATYGSVFGGPFSAADVLGAFTSRQGETAILGGLEILRDQGVIVGVDDHRFTHSLFAETAYDRLSFSLRAELHLSVIEHLERSRPEDLDELAADLARHAASTDDDDRKRRYYRTAADQAAARYSNDVSLHWYRGLVPLLEGEERGEVQLALGEIEAIAGDLEVAERHLRSAIRGLASDRRLSAEIELTRVLVQCGRADEGFALIDGAIERCQTSNEWTGLRAALDAKADLSTMLGDLDRAGEVERVHHLLAEAVGADDPLGEPLVGLIPLLWLRGDLDAAVSSYSALFHQLIEAGDLAGAGGMAADLAGLFYERGDIDGTFTWLETARSTIESVGNDRMLISAVFGNEVAVRARLGDEPSAIRLALYCLDAAVDLGNPATVSQLLTALGSLRTAPDRLDLHRRAVVLASSAGDPEVLSDAFHGLAAALRDAGHAEEAVRLVGALLDPNGRAYDHMRLDRAIWLAESTADAGEAVDRELAELRDGLPSLEMQARAAAALAIRTGEDTDRALRICRQAFADFPSADLADAIGSLGGSRPALVSLPPPSVVGAVDFGDVMRRVDVLPRLQWWSQHSEQLVAERLAGAHRA